jgi:hypothetical protein
MESRALSVEASKIHGTRMRRRGHTALYGYLIKIERRISRTTVCASTSLLLRDFWYVATRAKERPAGIGNGTAAAADFDFSVGSVSPPPPYFSITYIALEVIRSATRAGSFPLVSEPMAAWVSRRVRLT